MKFKYQASRPRLVTILISDGDTIEVSSDKSVRQIQRVRHFTEVKKVTRKKATPDNLTI